MARMKHTRSAQSAQSADHAAAYVFWKDPGFFGALIMGACLLVVVIKLCSPEDGLLKVREVKRIKAGLEDNIARLEAENHQLREAIDVMQTDPFQKEKIAREELNMALPGEIIYKFAE